MTGTDTNTFWGVFVQETRASFALFLPTFWRASLLIGLPAGIALGWILRANEEKAAAACVAGLFWGLTIGAVLGLGIALFRVAFRLVGPTLWVPMITVPLGAWISCYLAAGKIAQVWALCAQQAEALQQAPGFPGAGVHPVLLIIFLPLLAIMFTPLALSVLWALTITLLYASVGALAGLFLATPCVAWGLIHKFRSLMVSGGPVVGHANP
ncbi:MAG: hypothetical protein V1798_10285 [Pseudomonadota bacterium]